MYYIKSAQKRRIWGVFGHICGQKCFLIFCVNCVGFVLVVQCIVNLHRNLTKVICVRFGHRHSTNPHIVLATMKGAGMLSGTWQEIPDFPGFLISNDGRIWSHRSNRELSLSHNSAGLVKVNLVRDGINHSRLVKILVAEAYVEIPRWAHQEVFSHPELDRDIDVGVANPRTLTPINKDGDQTNNHWLNLVWRPRWYAWKYTRQFSHDIDRPEYHVPVFNATTEIIYETIIDAGIADGMLWSDIVIAAVEERPRFPEHMLYSFI